VDAATERVYSWKDVAKHNTSESCWVSVRGKVYDVTSESTRDNRYTTRHASP
jgi:predicted heme/steroid binding protein